MTGEQLPLFPEPRRVGIPRPRGVMPDDGRVRYAPYHTVVPRHCDDCVREVRARGWNKAPRIATARYKRTHEGQIDLLCYAHKEARMTTESNQ